MQSNNSRLGVKGEEQLGGGLAAVYQVESGFSATTGRTNKNNVSDTSSWGTLASRDTLAGLSSKTFGTFWAGRRDTPYKRSSSSFDFFSETIGDMNNVIANAPGGTAKVYGAGGFHQRLNRSIGYDGAWNGLYVDLQAGTPDPYSAIDANGKATVGVPSGTPRFSTLSGLIGYRVAGADILYSVEENKNVVNGTGFTSAKAQQVAVGYTLPAQYMGAKLGAAYEKIDTDVPGTNTDSYSHNNWWVNASLPFAGNNAVGVAYGKAGNSARGGANANGAKMWALGATHNFTPKTSVYATYADMKNDAAGTYGLGVDHGDVSSEYGPVNGAAGQTVKGFSVGMLTKF